MSKINIKYEINQCINRIKKNTAVSEVIGSVLMLSIVVSTFGFFYYNVSSIPPPSNPPNVSIISYVENNNLVFEHQKGDSLSLDTAITINMGIVNEMFLVKNYLDPEAIKDGEWNIGERVIYPLPYTKENIQNYFASSIDIANIESNSLVFMGTLDVYPETDLGITITADNLSPSYGSEINFTICVTNYQGGTPAVNIEILNILSKNFSYFSNITSRGFYNSDTCIWNISYLEVGETACLTITAIVTLTSEATQLAMILDGSGSISSSDWSLMKEGLARSIENSSTFPHDGNVELTVIQFGGDKAKIELNPTIVTKYNYANIGNKIRSISQLTGATPMCCGIRLAADQLRNSGFFNVNKRQIINLVTDGVANCYGNGYTGTYQGYDGWFKGYDQVHTGNYSAKSNTIRNGHPDFTCDDLDTSGATSILVDFWYRLDDTESDDLSFYVYNGNSYTSIKSIGDGTEDNWLHYTKTFYKNTNPQYFRQNFKIQLKASCDDSTENVWIDDVIIKANNNKLLDDSFESDYWAENWWNPGLKSSEEASLYLNKTLQMTNDQDEFNCLGVGVGGMYGGPDIDWLKNKIVWPQPGQIAPPYIAGWVKTITSWQDFEKAIKEIFMGYFGFSNDNTVKIIAATPFVDPNPEDNEVSIIITPV
jgi:uncharacterized repeat protein (TIGR01451 family)